MREKRIPVMIAIGLIIILIMAFIGWEVAQRYIPSKEPADLAQVLGVSGEETAIFLNEEIQEATGITREGQTYLPLKWVNSYLNEKFYWDNVEKLLVYTLPDSVVYADKRTAGSTGMPLLLAEGDEIYLSMALVNNYTAVDIKNYSDGEHKRVYMDNRWQTMQWGSTAKTAAVRVEGNIKSPVLTYVEKGREFVILEQSKDWSKVRTEDGFTGYMKNNAVRAMEMRENPCTIKLPEYTNIAMEEKVCLAWHQVTHEDANSAMEQLIANTKGVNVIAPTWFALTDNNGSYHSYADRSYVDKAHERGMQVWAVLDNFNMGENVNSEILFAQTSVRKKLIANLMEDVKTYDLDGINLDIEGIKPSAGPHYVQFIRELSVSCRKEQVVLSIDNYVPAGHNFFYNRAEQGRVADYVIVMGYDEHYAGGEAGSVASYSYVKDGIENTLKDVPHEKIINAVPFYTRVWTEKDGKTTSSALGIEGAKKWIEENDVELYWQEPLGQYYGELQTVEGLKQIWMEEETSLGLKMDLIKKYDLAGVGCWKLGFEPASIWDIVKVNE
ncbi:MAG: SH3 domain-containing protein [Hungatella sp.]|nr:SH3 domain-containing protein [Hungatella sp.]